MLPAPYRLRLRRDFKRVYQRGQALALPTLALHWRKNGRKGTRIGFSVSKKLGKAVARNRVKRRCRAAAAALLVGFPPGFDLIFVARVAAKDADFARIQADMERALAQMRRRLKATQNIQRVEKQARQDAAGHGDADV